MKNYSENFLVDGSSALDTNRIGKHAHTHIIEFPTVNDPEAIAEGAGQIQGSKLTSKFGAYARSAAKRSEMFQSLKHGTCAGKPVGKMTPVQSAAACGAFFLFFVSLLMFV